MKPLINHILKCYRAEEELLYKQLILNRDSVAFVDDQFSRPHGLVVCSIWEYDNTLLSAKMFERALAVLIEQSKSAEIDLDFIVVANNGGSSDPAVREELADRLSCLLSEKLPHHRFERLTTSPSDLQDKTVPWKIEADLASPRDLVGETGHKALLVIQPFHPSNHGKICAIRDVTHFVRDQIINHAYSADFVFQMDAETILKFRQPEHFIENSPFGDLYKFFKTNNYTAVGTRDRFAIFDPETGCPLPKPVGSLQIGWEIMNRGHNLITLPGGALMAKPSSYVSAMIQLANYFPCLVTEDYAYTKLLRCLFAEESCFEAFVALHPGIEHLNRTPPDAKAALSQLEKWKKQSNAVDHYFPGNDFVPFNIIRAAFLNVVRRIQDIRHYGMSSLLKLFEDLISLPSSYYISHTKTRDEI
jgi:hypothetical protein